MENQIPVEEKRSLVPVFVVVGIAALVVVAYLIISHSTPKTGSSAMTETTSGKVVNTPAPVVGSMTIEKGTGPGEVVVRANSNGTPVVGYDVNIMYDSKNLTFVKPATSQLTDFQAVATAQGDVLYVTGIQKLQSKTKTVLNGQPILTLKFTAQKPGTYEFTVTDQSNQYPSKMMNENAEPLMPKTNKLSVEIQ